MMFIWGIIFIELSNTTFGNQLQGKLGPVYKQVG